ncbi:hypothetical protein JCGZ_12821 [Jatropha curcas]|uniref:Uncharacterized protein n=1 Tax=Jatropha curcas TaxID=180498 RepID=A0A067KDX3_JATCU|nr:hypothetical protein JCGZ_12821 [Jatropha curcas]
MSQLLEIPASAYTPEMNTLGAIPDIPVFEGERTPFLGLVMRKTKDQPNKGFAPLWHDASKSGMRHFLVPHATSAQVPCFHLRNTKSLPDLGKNLRYYVWHAPQA